MKGNVIVGQSGGPTAVINSSLAGVIKAARKLGAGYLFDFHLTSPPSVSSKARMQVELLLDCPKA